MKTKNKAGKPKEASLHSTERLFVLNIPLAVILLLLVLTKELNPYIALFSFLAASALTVVLILPFLYELEKFVSHLRRFTSGKNLEEEEQSGDVFFPSAPEKKQKIILSRRTHAEVSKISDALSQLKENWRTRMGLLEAQTLSDAAIIENLPDPLLMIDVNKRVVGENKAARSLFHSSLINEEISSFIKDKNFLIALSKVLEGEQSKELIEFSLPTEKETVYFFRARIERLPAVTKFNACLVVALHDITLYRQIEQSQTDFFANASHELKTPLSVLSGLIETLQGPAKDDHQTQEKFLNMMSEQTQRMTQLVQDLLSLTKLHSPSPQPQNDVILIQDLLLSIQQSFRHIAEKNNMKINVKFIHDIPRLKGNLNDLYRVFQNLVDNAVKYGEKGSEITIEAYLTNGFPQEWDIPQTASTLQVAAVCVHNTGNPIPASQISRLTERFYRLETTRGTAVGTGLGLGIVKQIVMQHGGLLDIKSSKEDGTSFTVYLPTDF